MQRAGTMIYYFTQGIQPAADLGVMQACGDAVLTW
jgi:hypothetical protein